jgi:hypothetical protein
MDNWIAVTLAGRLRQAGDPLVIDLGYGDSAVTVLELSVRLRRVRPDVRVTGLEIDPERVRTALPFTQSGVSFRRGGFELAGDRPALVRAANVLRQYPESAIDDAWAAMQAGLAPGGVVVEGTCDELGRRGSWVLLDESGPVSLTLSCRLEHLRRPSDVADRLVKALIHRNVPGQNIHRLLCDLDRAWGVHAALGAFGPRQRWLATTAAVATDWPVIDPPSRHRFGEMTVAWNAVRPD